MTIQCAKAVQELRALAWNPIHTSSVGFMLTARRIKVLQIQHGWSARSSVELTAVTPDGAGCQQTIWTFMLGQHAIWTANGTHQDCSTKEESARAWVLHKALADTTCTAVCCVCSYLVSPGM